MFGDLSKYVPIAPIDVVIPHDNPWLVQHRIAPEFLLMRDAVAELFPGRRPRDLLKTSYAELRRRGLISGDPVPDDAERESKVADLISLIDSIFAQGFIRGDEWTKPVESKDWHVGPACWYGPPTFGIDANGLLVHHDGRHRAAIMSLLGEPLPARIVAHHVEWDDIFKQTRGYLFYDRFDHPEFLDAVTVRRRSEVRFGAVLDWLSGRRFDCLIDIGSNAGHFPALAAERFWTVAVESNPMMRRLAACWLAATGGVADFRESLDEVKVTHRDAVTAFSVIQHLAHDQDSLLEVVSKIAVADTLILEVPNCQEPIWHRSLTSAVGDPWRFVHEVLIGSGFQFQVLYVDRAHLNRQTVAYYR